MTCAQVHEFVTVEQEVRERTVLALSSVSSSLASLHHLVFHPGRLVCSYTGQRRQGEMNEMGRKRPVYVCPHVHCLAEKKKECENDAPPSMQPVVPSFPS
mmetsp:Transcript_12971/g.25362  ORF Transcript_12971/g.25362 Transcript_12971/m.25362 type:complete len:100 (+) Transcript_12971:1210-1509(+)